MEAISCKKCGLVDDYKTSNSGQHIRADCNGCGAYIKFLPQSPAPEIKFHFGKYAGTRIADVTDLSYLHWAKENLMSVNARTKEAIANRLNQLTT